MKVRPDGDDLAAAASHGLLPFEHIQSAIDFADSHRDVALDVCVAASDMSESGSYYSSVGDSDIHMRNGISVYGGYSSDFTARTSAPSAFLLMTSAGVVFRNDVTTPTKLDGFWLEPLGTAITVDGARGASVSNVSVIVSLFRASPPAFHGVDARGASVDLENIAIKSGLTLPNSFTGDVYGVQAFDSLVTLRDSSFALGSMATTNAVWLEDCPGSRIEHNTLELYASDGHGVRVIRSDGVDILGNSISFEQGVEVSDSADITLEDNAVVARTSGLWLERVPGSLVQGGSVEVNGAGAVDAIHVTGDARGVEIHGATVLLRGGVDSAGIWLDDCGGAAPVVSENPSVVALNSDRVDVIRATGDCHPTIASNGLIGAEFPVDAFGFSSGGTATSVYCGAAAGTASRCRILDNPRIRNAAYPDFPNIPSGVGILCDAGACAEISNNNVVGLEESGTPVTDPFRSDTLGTGIGIELFDSDVLIDRNVVQGGCGTLSIGIDTTGGAARIQNNLVQARASSCKTEPQPKYTFQQYGLRLDGADDVHSNDIWPGSGSVNGHPCTSAAVMVSAPALLRNNIFGGSNCSDFHDVWVDRSTPPRVLQNNAFAPLLFLAPGIYHGPADLTLEQVNALPGASNNIYLLIPQFADGWHLLPDSVCIDAGTPDGAPLLDFDGEPRSTVLPDIGADEWSNGIEACAGLGCSGHGVCRAEGTEPFCECHPGYRNSAGNALVCEDVDECALDNGGCDPLTVCGNTLGGRTCSACPPGYAGSGSEGCRFDPCLLDHGGCDPLMTCEVVEGSAVCGPCPQGYQNPPGNPRTCADLDECANGNGGCDPLTACTNTPGSRMCGPCPTGYVGSGENGCSLDPCPTQNGGCDPLTACDASSGSVVCGPCPPGYAGTGQSGCVRDASPFVQVSTASAHSCGVRASGAVECWGYKPFFWGDARPVAERFTAISAGSEHTMAIRTDGSLAFWGNAQNDLSSPPSGQFQAVIAGAYHDCALAVDGSLHCWGSDAAGQTDAPSGTFTAVGVGTTNTCALRLDGTIVCFGSNEVGESSPPAGTFLGVDVHGAYGCGLRTDGSVECWGQQGLQGWDPFDPGPFKGLACGGAGFACCGIAPDDTLSCWGDGTAAFMPPPAGTYLSLSIGNWHACGIRTDQSIVCWGDDSYGQASPP